MSDDTSSRTTASNWSSRIVNDPRIQSLLSLDVKWLDRFLTVIILVIVTALLFETRQYSWEAQRAPVFVLGAVFLLTVLELLRQVGVVGSVDYESKQAELKEDIKKRMEGVEEMPLLKRRTEIIRTILWISFLFALVYVLGLLLGSLVFLLTFYFVEAHVGALRTAVYSGVIFLFMWVMFEVLLKARLYPGIFEFGEVFYYSQNLF